jgi:aspartyl-tRNA(Asn)/glutamyl-tRNA(Gln) amidotransferase subunit C
MSQLTLEDIKKLADLAKIEVTEAETVEYLKDINNILGHVSQVTEANTTGVDKQHRFYNTLRPDTLDNREYDRETIFKNIPDKSGDYVRVAKVIKK